MKNIVVYSGKTGFTKKYAEWIAKELSCEAVDIHNCRKEELSGDTRIIYGGSIFAGKIQDLEKFRKVYPAPSVVFAVGLTEPGDEYCQQLRSANVLGDIPFFYLRGGAAYEKLGFLSRVMLKKITGLKESVDFTDRKYLEPLFACVKGENR